MPTTFGYSRPSASRPDPAEHLRQLTDAGATRCYVDKMTARAPRAMPQRRKMLTAIKAGDALILTTLDRLGTQFDDMVRCFALLVERGVQVRILEPEFTIDASCQQAGRDLLALLRVASTALHSDTIKRNLAAARAAGGKPAGKQPILADDMWPDIQARIQEKTIETVAGELGVSRQTLWTFRRRMTGRDRPPAGDSHTSRTRSSHDPATASS